MFGFVYIINFVLITMHLFPCLFFTSFVIGMKLIELSLFFLLLDWKLYIQFLDYITRHDL